MISQGRRIDLRSDVVIDASGDADVVAMAGLPSFVGDNGRVQNPTMIFRLSGVDDLGQLPLADNVQLDLMTAGKRAEAIDIAIIIGADVEESVDVTVGGGQG